MRKLPTTIDEYLADVSAHCGGKIPILPIWVEKRQDRNLAATKCAQCRCCADSLFHGICDYRECKVGCDWLVTS